MNNIGRLLLNEGKPGEAEPLIREALEKNRRVQGEDNPDTLISIDAMGALDVAQGRYADAVAVMAPAEAAMRKAFTGDEAKRVGSFLMHIGKARTGLKEFPAAEANLLEAQPLIVKILGPGDRAARECDRALVALYTDWEAVEPGRGHGAKVAEWKAKLDEAERAAKVGRKNEK